MEIVFTFRVKGKDVPEFVKGMGKGVLATVTINTEDGQPLTPAQRLILHDEVTKTILDEIIEVTVDEK